MVFISLAKHTQRQRIYKKKTNQFNKRSNYVQPVQSAGKRVHVIGFAAADWFKKVVRLF